MPLVNTASAPIWYADHRDVTLHRPVTLLIHGAGGTHLDWPAELRRLPDANAVIPDLPGHGRSPLPGRSSIAAYAADMVALLDALKIGQAIIGGHSMGGAIAQTMALHYPDRVAGLLLIGTAAKLGVHPDILNHVRDETPRIAEMLVNWYYGAGVTDTLRRRSKQQIMSFDPQILYEDYLACSQFDLRGQIAQIKTPTLIIGGTGDQMTPFKHSEFLRDTIPGAQLVTLAGAGHFMTLEQPQAVADAAQRWLLENG
jgi:pimeloyl-ACP methyl ester carboxylesterase